MLVERHLLTIWEQYFNCGQLKGTYKSRLGVRIDITGIPMPTEKREQVT